MDFKKLAKVADSISQGSKQKVTAEGRQVIDGTNPLDALEEREKIKDSSTKVVIIDDQFLKKLSQASRGDRRKFISRLSDSQKRRVLTGLKKIKDSGYSERLGYILLDDLLANVLVEPSETNVKNLDDFVEEQQYMSLSDNMRTLIDQVTSGDLDLNKDALAELQSGMGERTSHLISLKGEEEPSDEFEIPEEEELTEEEIATLEDSAKKHVELFKKNKNFCEVTDAADEIIAEMQGKNRNYGKTSKAYWDAFKKEWDAQFKGDDVFNTMNSKEIADAIDAALDVMDEEQSKLDDVFDNPAIDTDGKEVKDVEETSIIGLLSEALEDYVNGNTEKLDELTKHTISTEVVEEGEEPKEPEEEPEEEEDVNLEAEDEELLADSVVHFARRLRAGKRVNKLVDALKSRVVILNKVNFKVTDCCLPNHEECGEGITAMNMPLSCEEYNALCKPEITPLMYDILEECKANGTCLAVPPVESVEMTPEGFVSVNNGQMYVPTIPVDEFEERIKAAENNETLHEIVSSCAVNVEDALKVAAKCDNLSFIDTKFYRPSYGASHWEFNPEDKPACLVECPEGHCISRCREDKANYHLFGVPFVVS